MDEAKGLSRYTAMVHNKDDKEVTDHLNRV